MKKFLQAAAVAVVMAPSALAQDGGGIAVDGYLGLLSDFRDRGLSLSDKDPSLVASLGLFSDSGFYGGVMGAIVDDGVGGDAKAEFYAGYQMDRGDYIYDFSVELDSIHGNDSRFYPEFKATMARDFGLAFIRTGVSFAPDGRWSAPDSDSVHVFTDLEVPVPTMPEFTLIGRIGRDFLSGQSNRWDWGLGVSAFIDQVEISLMYEDSSVDSRAGNGTVVLGARFYF